ncbi:MAG: phosphoenolpyruvate synthase [Candidatus Thermoplasmatota archaeon]
MKKEERFILWFEEIGAGDIALVGGKSASLGEMFCNLTAKGVRVPNGFAVTARAYRHFIESTGISKEIEHTLQGLETKNLSDLQARGQRIRALIRSTPLPDDLKSEIAAAYDALGRKYGMERVDVAVRSSATSEDLPDASFAGQQDTYLNVRGEEAALEACRMCFASLFTDRAISYRTDKEFGQMEVSLSIAVQKMVRADRASSGIIFTLDTETGFRNVIVINSAYGLGENIVGGRIVPDEFYVFKPKLNAGKRAIIGKRLGTKEMRMIYGDKGARTQNIEVESGMRERYSVTDDEVLQLADWAALIEEHYGRPMDIEWAKDGDGTGDTTGQLFVVQARPETVHSAAEQVMRTYVLREKGREIVSGVAVGSMIGSGRANVITEPKNIHLFKEGDVLVTEMTDPDWEPIMKIASAIVTDRGGRTCHAAIISRELGIPCIVGTKEATKRINLGQEVTVSCADGEIGMVYEGALRYEVEERNLKDLPRPRTKIMMNVGIPENAFAYAMIPNDGVGLAREEFIINSHIGIHPMALVDYEEIKARAHGDLRLTRLIEEIDRRTVGHADKEGFFVEKLAMGIAKIAAAFYPNDVIVRLSDFKTNEYANLVGGFLYETEESNPMLGWRGASRYYDPRFRPAFSMECRALRYVRDTLGLTNVKAMVPFCRTPEEGRRVIKVMAEEGLVQGENGFEVYVMAEIPSNCVDAHSFAEIFDGFSIGSNDLTQLALGLDRDSELVSHIYNERDATVKRLVKLVIDAAKAKGRKIGICGQAPSDFPDFAEFLVECGIDSISLNPDTVVKTRLIVAKKEDELGIRG